MGFCFSCCRKQRRKTTDEEREPLLNGEYSNDITPTSGLEKLGIVLGALRAGKFPSQTQITIACQKILLSNVLSTQDGNIRDLPEQGRRVLIATRELLESLIRLGLEKNGDDLLQNLVYKARRISSTPFHSNEQANMAMDRKIQKVASSIPSEDEVKSDFTTLLQAVQSLSFLLVSSAAFRLLLSDFMLAVREVVADKVAVVEQAAAKVEATATAIEEIVRPTESANATASHEDIEYPITEKGSQAGSNQIKEAILNRVEDIFRRASSKSSYNSALRTILYLFRKYAERIRIASETVSEVQEEGGRLIEVATTIIIPDPRISEVVQNLKQFIERLAGRKPLDPVVDDLFVLVGDVTRNPDSQVSRLFFDKVGKWLDIALKDPAWATSRKGRAEAEQLYDELQVLMDQDSTFSRNLRKLLNDVDNFITRIKTDEASVRVLDACDSFVKSVQDLTLEAAEASRRAAAHWKRDMLKLVLGWLMPRIMHVVTALPMPRVEYISEYPAGKNKLAVALDALMLSIKGELFPDRISFTESSHISVELDPTMAGISAAAPAAVDPAMHYEGIEIATRKVNLTSRIHVHMEGLRLEVHDMGYYARYDLNSWLGYEDEGLASIKVGKAGVEGEGMSLDIEVEVNAETVIDGGGSNEEIFKVIDVTADLPGLDLRIARSKHWILNFLFAPLAGPIGRQVISRIMAKQVKSMLENLEEKMRIAQKSVEEDGETTGLSYASALFNSILEECGHSNEKEDEDELDEFTEIETSVNLKGVVRTTYTQVEPEAVGEGSNKAPEVDEVSKSTIAVGMGAQILAGKGDPEEQETAGQAAREAVEDVTNSVLAAKDRTEDAVTESLEEAGKFRRETRRAQAKLEARNIYEGKRRGWRSDAFDF